MQRIRSPRRYATALCVVLATAAGIATETRADTAPERILTTCGAIAAEATPPGAVPASVRLDATASFQDAGRTIFLADDTGVTFVFGGDNPVVQPGDVVHIEGAAQHGVIMGGIRPTRIAIVGHGPPPACRAVTPDDLATGRFHYQLVEITGVVRSLAPEGEGGRRLTLGVAGSQVVAVIESVGNAEVDAAPGRLIDALVTVRGLAAGNVNERRQIVEPFIRVKRLDDVAVTTPPPANPFAAPIVPLSGLKRSDLDDHRVRVRGTALSAPVAGGIFLREAERSVFVETKAIGIAAGDVVEAVGFPLMGFYSVHLTEAVCRVVGSAPVPEPRLGLPGRPTDRVDADLVRFSGELLQRLDGDGRTEMIVAGEGLRCTVLVPGQVTPGVVPGSRVQVTGVCRVTAAQGSNYRAVPTAYTIWLKSTDDLVVQSLPPWWTSRRIALAVTAGLAAAAVAAAVAIGWILLLRRQVRNQLRVIEGKLQAEAVAEERRRIAREFHDTLDQGLAALSLRMDVAAHGATDDRARDILQQQRQVLSRLQTESRDFLWDLRDPVHVEGSLTDSIQTQLRLLEPLAPVPLEFETDDLTAEPRPQLPAAMQHQLLRIVREAVHNAIKYARATRIVVRLDTQPSNGVRGILRIGIRDDGGGFDVAARSAAEGHFGIRGMQERAVRIGAELVIESRPGDGTYVVVTLPFAAPGVISPLTAGTGNSGTSSTRS
jgi:signal transduction histidine kinase